MKLTYITTLAMMALAIAGCMKDKSAYDSRELSDISVNLQQVPDTIHIDRHSHLVLDPEVKSEGSDALQYEWQVNYKTVSSEKKIDYPCTTLGLFPVRLKVWNSDGAVFKDFVLSVNSQYEEGIMLLSEKQDGSGEISFMRTYSAAELQAGKVETFETDCFERNNPGEQLGSGVSDIVKRDKQLMVAVRNEGRIKVMNAKTLELESIASAPDLTAFKPVRINEPDNGFRKVQVLSADGKVYDFATNEQQILNASLMPAGKQFSLQTAMRPGLNFNSNYYWEPAASKLWNLWYISSSTLDTLKNQELITFFQADGLVYVLSKNSLLPGEYSRAVFGEFLQVYFQQPLDCKEHDKFTPTGVMPAAGAPTALGSRYKKLFYAAGNQIYQWYYSTTNFPAQPVITLDIPGTVVCMDVSPDGEHLYVAVNDAGATGLTGSVAVYNVNTGVKERSFVGAGHKPVKIMYKKK